MSINSFFQIKNTEKSSKNDCCIFGNGIDGRRDEEKGKGLKT
jgi:hypothetical protein